jgi:outer membrane biosynthesis protein TonB
MLRCFPLVPLAAQQAVGIALLSYDGRIGVGLIGDADAAKELPALSAALRASLDELKQAASTKAEPEPKPEPEPELKPEPERKLDPERAPAPDSDRAPEPKPATQTESQTQTQTQTAPAPQTPGL